VIENGPDLANDEWDVAVPYTGPGSVQLRVYGLCLESNP
jgi:hypothetical protein